MSSPGPDPEAGGVAVIGVGNPYRRDDGAGPAVLARLRHMLPATPGVRLADLDGEPVRIIHTWEGTATAWVVDAVRTGAPAGTVTEWDLLAADQPLAVPTAPPSGHALGIGEAVALGRALDRLPGRLVLIGIEGGDFTDGPGCSPAVDAAIVAVAQQLLGSLLGLSQNPS